MQNSDKATVCVFFNANIEPHTTQVLINTLSNLANKGVKTVQLLLSSNGGDVGCGLALYHVLRGMPFELITHNVGCVDSIGVTVFLAGTKRYACPDTSFLLHGIRHTITVPVQIDDGQARDLQAINQRSYDILSSILKRHTNLEGFYTQPVQQQIFTAADALQCGLIHNIADVVVEPGTEIGAMVFPK